MDGTKRARTTTSTEARTLDASITFRGPRHAASKVERSEKTSASSANAIVANAIVCATSGPSALPRTSTDVAASPTAAPALTSAT